MEPLRWILLIAGIAFVLVIYFLGRNHRRRNNSQAGEHPSALDDDLPAFTAQTLDDFDEGVGKVRVISGGGSGFDEQENHSKPAVEESVVSSEQLITQQPEQQQVDSSSKKTPSDIIVLYILPKTLPQKNLAGDSPLDSGNYLSGDQINSSVQALGLTFGEMNIYHYHKTGRNVFSLANMLEPGYFDADTIHDLKTSGLTVFMKLKTGETLDVSLDNLTEMLQRSYQIASLLDARLCNQKRQTLTEQDAENYRAKVHEFINAL